MGMKGLMMRIGSGCDTHASRRPGCELKLLGHRAEGQNLGEVLRSTKSFLKTRIQQVSGMRLLC